MVMLRKTCALFAKGPTRRCSSRVILCHGFIFFGKLLKAQQAGYCCVLSICPKLSFSVLGALIE